MTPLETPTSIPELIYDLALFLLLTRLAFFYFILSFLTTQFLTYLQHTRSQHLSIPLSTTPNTLLPLYLFLTYALWARYLIVSSCIPKNLGFRLAIGGAAVIFMVIAELVRDALVHQKKWTVESWVSRILGSAVFALMPTLLMVSETSATTNDGKNSVTVHGSEKKCIVEPAAAVPMVEVVDDIGGKEM